MGQAWIVSRESSWNYALYGARVSSVVARNMAREF